MSTTYPLQDTSMFCKLPEWMFGPFGLDTLENRQRNCNPPVVTISTPPAPLTRNQMTNPTAWGSDELEAYYRQRQATERQADVAARTVIATAPVIYNEGAPWWLWAGGGVAAILLLKAALR